MQFRRKLMCTSLGCVLLLSGVVLLVNVRAQTPKQAQIVFQSDRDGNFEIYVMDTNGKSQRNLTNNPADDVSPDWFDPAFPYAVEASGKFRGTWGWIKQTSK